MRSKWHALGAKGAPYPAAIANLAGETSGAYLIRSARNGFVLYVGESHTGRLYSTLTRHFQGWSRSKDFWRGAGFSKNDPGVTYQRHLVEVAFYVTPAARAVRLQDALIRKHAPRDNLRLGKDVDDDAGFDWIPEIPF